MQIILDSLAYRIPNCNLQLPEAGPWNRQNFSKKELFPWVSDDGMSEETEPKEEKIKKFLLGISDLNYTFVSIV